MLIFILTLLLLAVLLFYPRDGFLPFCHRLYVNGRIHTLNVKNEISDAMLVSCGRIERIGYTSDVITGRRWFTRTVDLEGRHILPGFIDAHSHFPLPGLNDVAIDLNPPPMGSTDSLEHLYRTIQQQSLLVEEGEWVFGFNYDNTAYQDGQHPDRESLDAVSAKHPVFVRHSSGHMGVANSLGLERLGITKNSLSALNPYIGKYPDTDELNGLLQERAAPSLRRFIKALSYRELWHLHRAAIDRYAASGYTSVQAGGVTSSNARLLGWLLRLMRQPLRLVYWVNHGSEGYTLADQGMVQPDTALLNEEYFHRSAVKLYADGSPQGFTAYLSEPYHGAAPGKEVGADALLYRGYPEYPPEKWAELVLHYWQRQAALAIHTNGDAAIDDVLQGIAQVVEEHPAINAYPVTLMHAQTLRQDQAELAAKLGVEASFFIAHTYYWGDWHLQKSLGPMRAENISPLRWAEAAGLSFTLHSDAPVTPVSAIDILWHATMRETRSGHVLGAHQRINRLSALRAITIDAARQAGVGHHRGSLEAGKVADFIVVSDDPMRIENIRDLTVLETIVGGRRVYTRTHTREYFEAK